jgi:hypothetical protein
MSAAITDLADVGTKVVPPSQILHVVSGQEIALCSVMLSWPPVSP